MRTAFDEILMTTRVVRRRLDLDRLVSLELLRECVEIAQQAPSGSNAQLAHFVLVFDADKRAALAELYRSAWAGYQRSPGSIYARAQTLPEGPEREQMGRITRSTDYLVEHLHRVPVLVIPCIEGRLGKMPPGPYANIANASAYGSVMPATWSFMLAARARGLGCAWTTAHLAKEREAAQILGIPYERVTQTGMLPTAYFTGEGFRPARRRSVDEVLHLDVWQARTAGADPA